MKKYGITKGDMILAGLLAALAAVMVFLTAGFIGTGGGSVSVSVDGSEKAIYSLSEDREISLCDSGGNVTNVLQIREGKAEMKEADCPDQICVNHTAIWRQGETIVCLPHRIVVEVTEGETGGLDAVTN